MVAHDQSPTSGADTAPQHDQPAPRTVSARKLAANRRNARRSTGPRTPEGKAISAQNAQRSTGPRTPEGKAISARNARRSTGPRTAAGKAIASRNALTQGLWASGTLLLAGEEPHQWAALQHDLRAVLLPQDALEEVLVERVTAAVWRLRRLQRVETSLHALGAERVRLSRATNAVFQEMVGAPPAHVDEQAILEAQAWVRLAQEPDAWSGVQRAEASIERVLYRALAALSSRQVVPLAAPQSAREPTPHPRSDKTK